MNLKNINKLLAAMRGENALLKKLKIGFNMSLFIAKQGVFRDQSGHKCGTVACIGGTAAILQAKNSEERDRILRYDDVSCFDLGKEWLDLSEDQASRLFYAIGSRTSMEKISLAKAIRVVEKLRDTGKVSWR